MTTIHTTYYLDKAKEAQKSDNPEVASLGVDFQYAIYEIIELRERLQRERENQPVPDSPEGMLKILSRHYKQRVAPVGEYCQIFDDWIAACKEAHTRFDEWKEANPDTYHGSVPPLYKIREYLPTLRSLDIGKSSYLDRRIYGGEKHRTRMCPVHKGHWSGISLHVPLCGCDLTGWLPEDDDRP